MIDVLVVIAVTLALVGAGAWLDSRNRRRVRTRPIGMVRPHLAMMADDKIHRRKSRK